MCAILSLGLQRPTSTEQDQLDDGHDDSVSTGVVDVVTVVCLDLVCGLHSRVFDTIQPSRPAKVMVSLIALTTKNTIFNYFSWTPCTTTQNQTQLF